MWLEKLAECYGEKKRSRTAGRVFGKEESGSGRSYYNFRMVLKERVRSLGD